MEACVRVSGVTNVPRSSLGNTELGSVFKMTSISFKTVLYIKSEKAFFFFPERAYKYSSGVLLPGEFSHAVQPR